jgi:Ni/Co efflux regulator RcnB
MNKILLFAIGAVLVAGSIATAQDYNRERDRRSDHGAEPGFNRGDNHHDWGDREGFQREWGQHGADWDHKWRRGERLPNGYWRDQRYGVRDYWHQGLRRPHRGYHWVRYGTGFVQARDRDGLVMNFVLDAGH